jgi:hypothetical protein
LATPKLPWLARFEGRPNLVGPFYLEGCAGPLWSPTTPTVTFYWTVNVALAAAVAVAAAVEAVLVAVLPSCT